MAKTDLTTLVENALFRETNKQGVFGCFEVTIGWFGKERVDYLTYDTNGVWRCFEIKVSKADFHSQANITFVGHYNYYVVPQELYEEVKDEIPNDIGCYVIYKGGSTYFCTCRKKAKRRELGIDEQILKDSLIRSLSREVKKHMKSRDIEVLNRLQRQLRDVEHSRDEYRRRLYDLEKEIVERMDGDYRWRKRFPLPEELEEKHGVQ